jgi:isoquinoline 1-oxidoreductase alpha subunit
MSTTVTLNVNGVSQTVTIPTTSMPLLWVLRDYLGLTGTKYGCGIEVCGACTVLVGGSSERSCEVSVSEVLSSGAAITTIEGIAPNATTLHPVQQAWINAQVPQCGYCQSGMIVRAASAYNHGARGSSVASACGNLCVCGTYQRINQAAAGL